MFQISLRYSDGHEAPAVSIAQSMTIDQLKQALCGPQPTVLQAAGDPIYIDTRDAVNAIIRTTYGNRITKTQVINLKEDTMTEEADFVATEPVPEVPVEPIAEAPIEPVVETSVEAPVEVETVVAPEAPVEPENVGANANNSEVTETIEETKEMADDTNKVNEKFIGFREKFLDYESQQDSWEQQLIEKMAKRVDVLKGFADVLDQENSLLEEFKKDKLGK